MSKIGPDKHKFKVGDIVMLDWSPPCIVKIEALQPSNHYAIKDIKTGKCNSVNYLMEEHAKKLTGKKFRLLKALYG